MRINKHPTTPTADLRSVMKQLTEEYPDVPDDVTALILQAARQDLAPQDDPAKLLPKARIVLGESLLLQAMQAAAPRKRMGLAAAS